MKLTFRQALSSFVRDADRRTASAEEVRRAYLRLALCLHPDKAAARHAVAERQSGSASSDESSRETVRKVADEQFVRVERAYRVLLDPVRRSFVQVGREYGVLLHPIGLSIYDEYGWEGLEAFEANEVAKQTVGARLEHPKEVRRMLDRLLKEAAQRRTEAIVNTFGGITGECMYHPVLGSDGNIIKRHLLPEVTRLTVRQSTAVQVSESTQITCGGYAIHHAGMGAGSVYVSGRHALSSRQWLGSLVQLGQQQKVSLLCGASSSRGGSSVQTQCTYEPETGLGIRLSTNEHLDPMTSVDLSWGVGRGVGQGEEVTAGGGQWADLGLRLSYRHTLPPSRSFQISGKVGARGMESARGGLAEIVAPEDQREDSAEAKRYRNCHCVQAEGRGGAPSASAAVASVEGGGKSSAADGMVILRARYGSELSTDCGERWWTLAPWDATLADHSGGGGAGSGGGGGDDGEEGGGSAEGVAIAELAAAHNVDVTVPLQFFVKDSTLSLPHGSKSRLLGFYTPEACRAPPNPFGRSGRSQSRQRFDQDGWDNGQGHGHGDGGWSGERDNFGWFGFGGAEGGGDGELASPVEARLYIRYHLAGRTFEETFDDMEEVTLPSPAATYMGGEGVR
eukprot:jgi/Undpi1/12447/HiC_scaffold_5.g02118.m1